MFKSIFIAIIAASATSLITWLVSPKQQLATVDVLSITSAFIKEEAQKNHTAQEKEIAIKTFSHELEGALQRLSISKKLVLLPKEAVIKGCPDYTVTLTSMMKEGQKS